MGNESKVITVSINGEARQIPANATVAVLIEEMGLTGKRIALERNGEIVPRDRWGESAVAAADQFEIVRFVQGG